MNIPVSPRADHQPQENTQCTKSGSRLAMETSRLWMSLLVLVQVLVTTLRGIFNRPRFLPLSLVLLATRCHAGPPAFSWHFDSSVVSVAECQRLGIVITSLDNDGVSFGTPPYYLTAMEITGIPTTSFVGRATTALSWVVPYAAGTKLMLAMVDSTGGSGGTAPNLYTVTPGTNRSCIPAAPSSNFTVRANVSTTLATCQPWGLAISGGVKPYTVTLAALDSPSITNVTMGPGDNLYTWINRAAPGSQLLAAVSDATGIFARGTPFVETTGSQDVSCPGLVSSSGISSIAPEASQSPRATESPSHSPKKRNVTIIAVTVPIVILLLVIAGIAICSFNRRNKLAAERSGDLAAKPFVEERGSLAISRKHLHQEDNTPLPSTVSPVTQPSIVIQHVDGHAVEMHEIHVPPPYPASGSHA